MAPMAMSSAECRQEITNRLIACDEIERRYYGGPVMGADLELEKRLLKEIDVLEAYLDNPSLSQQQPNLRAVSGRAGGTGSGGAASSRNCQYSWSMFVRAAP